MSILSLEGSAETGARTDVRKTTETTSLLAISVFCLTGLALSLAFMPVDISALAWL